MFAKEEQRYGRNKSTAISHSFINSGEYRRRFDDLSQDKEINKLLYVLAKKMLNHRSGTLYEDMYWIDMDKVEVVCEIIDSTAESKIEYTTRIRKIVENKKGLLTIHSHPNSFPPMDMVLGLYADTTEMSSFISHMKLSLRRLITI